MTPDDPDAALVAALASDEAGLSREEMAEQAGLPVAVLEALEREGLVVPTSPGRYAHQDVALLAAGRTLLDAGVPLGELIALGRRATAALREVADEAVDVFVRFVRDPIHAAAATEDEAARRLLDAYENLLPATTTLVGEHFRQLLVARALARAAEELADDEARG